MLSVIKGPKIRPVIKNKNLRRFKSHILVSSLLILLILSVYAFTKAESLDSFIVDLQVPEIPELLWRDMESQIFPGEFNLSGYDWFTFYDPLYKRRVKTKLSGLSASHYATLATRSFRLRYGNNDYRFKSIASELSQNPNPNEYSAFTEIGIYNIAKDFYKYVPEGKLVTLNGKKDDILIQWEEPWENNVRENDFVLWSVLARNSFYAKDKQERYLPFAWNTRNQTRDDLIPQFIELMNPIYEATILSPKDFKETNFDFENMLTYLALNNIFGSGHLDSHNLLFIPEIKKDTYTWNMGLYDLSGLKSFVQPPIMQSLNPIYQYYLRNPKTAYLYQKKLYELNSSLLKSGMVSKFFKNISCEKVSKYSGFSDLLLKSSIKGSKLIDLNYYCTLNDRISNYEKVRAINLDNQFNDTSLHWRVFEEDGNQYLALHVPSLIGVKVNTVQCGLFSCKSKFKLTNKPWWQDENDWFLLPEPIREIRHWKTNLKPSHFTYIYEWTGKSEVKPEDIKMTAWNVITSKPVYPVKHIYPTFDIRVSEKSADKKTFKMELAIINPLDVADGFEMKKSNVEEVTKAEEATKEWWYVFNSSCIKTPKEKLKYEIDCSNYDKNAWPYPLTYSIELYHKGRKIHDYWGELYINFSFSKTKNALTSESINKYKITYEELISDKAVQTKISDIQTKMQSNELMDLLENASSIYFFPKNSGVEITDDLELSKNSVVWFSEGSIIKIWPLVNFKTGTLVSAGIVGEKVRFTYKPGTSRWSRMEISNGGYIDFTTIEGHSSDLGGVLAQDSEMYLSNSTLNGRYNLTCLSCSIYVDNLTLIEGDWGIKAKDSKLDISNVKATDVLHVFILEDSIGKIENVTADRNLRTNGNIDRIFEVIGPATDLIIKNVKTSNLNIFLSKYLYPTVEYEEVDLTNTNREVLDLDNKYIYKSLVEMSADDFAKEYKFLKRDKDDGNKFYFEDKKYELYEDIVVPKDVTLEFDPGARVYFDQNKGIMSYGKVIAEGTEDKPILISAIDKRWGVFALWGSKSSGIFKFVTFEKGEDKFFTGTRYTGTLSAFNSFSLVVENSVFRKSKGDDAINCYKSYCEIKNSFFEKNEFDAVDFDFTEGIIADNTFEENGNDAIDLSFDKSKVYNNIIKTSGDKGISVGEHSESLLYSNLIEKNNIGVEVKDDSTVLIINNTLLNNNIGINSYQKKRAFGGGGSAQVFNSKLNNTVETASDKWTSIEINDKFNEEALSEIIKELGVSPTYGLTN